MRSKHLHLFLVLAFASQFSLARAQSQTAATTKQNRTGPIIVERKPTAPQVVTVLHRLNGLKMLRLLIRSGEQFGAVDNIDEAFNIKSQVHTNIIAGLVLDDAETVAVWLPEADVEFESPLLPSPPPSTASSKGFPSPLMADALAAFASEAPDLTIIERDGKLRPVRYLGLDGITGLSMLKLSEKTLLPAASAHDKQISVGQRMRLFSPEPAQLGAVPSNAFYIRIGETAGQIVSVTQRAVGSINRIRIKSLKLTPANIGGVAVNDAGETVGIVTSVEGNEATLLPPSVIRSAAERVLARKGSVPRPWLGVSGEPIATTPLEQVVRKGWETHRAMSLIEDRRGILLTSVASGSPAADAALHPGDVIVRVNDSEVKSNDDLSLALEDVGGGNPVNFTLVRPDVAAPEVVTVKLSQAFAPSFALKNFQGDLQRALVAAPLVNRGIETIPLRPAAAARFGASGGLLVVYVQPETAVFESGLRPGDVIEGINGQRISANLPSAKLQELTNASYTLSVVRNRQKLVFSVVPSPQ
jgi:S1-C subfamily serine protease